jgi:hypothetical protein
MFRDDDDYWRRLGFVFTPTLSQFKDALRRELREGATERITALTNELIALGRRYDLDTEDIDRLVATGKNNECQRAADALFTELTKIEKRQATRESFDRCISGT